MKSPQHTLWILTAILASTGGSLLYSATEGPVSVVNPSFEDPVTPNFVTPVNGWIEEHTDIYREAIQSEDSANNVPQTDFGKNWLVLTDTGGVFQAIDTFSPDWSYSFTNFMIGDRSTYLFGSVEVELWVGNGTASTGTALSTFATLRDSASFDITESSVPESRIVDTFTLYTGSDDTAGETVWLRIKSTDGGGASGDSQVFCDNIEITGGYNPRTWGGFPVDGDGLIHTGNRSGSYHVINQPWLYSYSLQKWVYFPEPAQGWTGAWNFVPIPVEVVAAPRFAPAAGHYDSEITVALSSETPEANIRYTTDGSSPTSTSGTVYSSPFPIASTTTVKAIAYRSGMPDSTVASATYTITAGNSSFPTPSTTGPSGILTPYSGTLTTSSDGQLIENLDISGGIKINHKNVTIRNCRFSGLDIATSTPTTGENCVVEDSELSWAGRQNFTLRRCYMTVVSEDLIRIGGPNVIIEDCYLLIQGPRKDGAHSDIIQVYPVADYDNLVVNHNTMYNECNATSCINGPHMTITNNLLAGGSLAIYTSRSTITNNRFSTIFFPGVGSNGIFYGTNSDNICSGNEILETGAAVNCQ